MTEAQDIGETPPEDGPSLARRARGLDRLIEPALFVSFVLLCLGLTVPVIRVSRLFFFTDEVSILQGIGTLYDAGEYLIAAVVLIFSVLFPLTKIFCALYLWRTPGVGAPRHRRVARLVEELGKWSMLDVLVAALVIVSVKASFIADAGAEPGLYLFFASVLIAMLATIRIRQAVTAAERAAGEGAGFRIDARNVCGDDSEDST